MKPSHLLPPAAALAAACLWLGFREHSISTLEEKAVLLRQHVESAGPGGTESHDRSLATVRAREKKEGLDWRRIAESQANSGRGTPDLREMLQLQTRLLEMSGVELLAALDEIAALDLDEAARRNLESTVIGVLVQKDPQAALERYIDRIGDSRSSLGGQLATAFYQWAGKDRNAALAWFDTQIAAGKFESKALDGKSEARIDFEASAVALLLEADTATAGRRLAALPADQRGEVLKNGLLMTLKPGTEMAFAGLVREHVAEDRRGNVLASATSLMLVRGGYDSVGKFLGSVQATPSERKEVVKQAARNKISQLSNRSGIDRQAVDEMRAWAAAESPGNADAITGEVLANVGGSAAWETSARMIGELQAASPGDDLLVSFLKGHRSQSPENLGMARELAARITDGAKRNEVLKLLGN